MVTPLRPMVRCEVMTARGLVLTRTRIVAWTRAVLATAAALAAGLLADSVGEREELQALSGLVWVPWAGLVALAVSAGTVPRWLPSAAAAGDLVVVFAGSLVVDDRGDVAALLYALVVVAAAWSGGIQLSLPIALAAVALPILAGEIDSEAAVDPLLLGVLAVVVAAVVAVLDGAAAAQRRSEVRSRRLEGRAAAILDHVGDGVVVCDRRGRIVEVNPAAARLIGVSPADLQGAACHDVLRLHVGERALDCSGGCPLLADDIEMWRPAPSGDGRQPLLVSIASVDGDGDGDDEPSEVVHSLRDITRLKQADEAKTLFLATASHELKTPLTVIAGFAQTLRMHENLAEKDRTYALQAIDVRARELSRIVDRLLLSSRIEAGRVDVRVGPTVLDEIVRERAESLERAAGREVLVELDLEPGALVIADPTALATVLDHLLDNAVKYSPGGEPVRVVVRRPSDELVELIVADDGIGMSAEAVAHCFDKFWQDDSGDHRRYGGTGIGLYIVGSLVDAMGATIRLDSVPGSGSTFTVTLSAFLPDRDAGDTAPPVVGVERSMVREFMRQIGVGGDPT